MVTEQIVDPKQDKPKGGKSSKTKVFAYRLPLDLAATLERRAGKLGISPSAYSIKTMTKNLTRNHHQKLPTTLLPVPDIPVPDNLATAPDTLLEVGNTTT